MSYKLLDMKYHGTIFTFNAILEGLPYSTTLLKSFSGLQKFIIRLH